MNTAIVSTICLLASALSFSHLDVDGGLSQSSVFSIKQDRSGCVWFATYDGLCRFDGNDITVFRHEDGSEKGPCSNIIRHLAIDSEGNIWAASDMGFSCIDPQTLSFRNIYAEKGNLYVNCLEEYGSDYMLAKAGSQTYILDKQRLTVSDDLHAHGLTKDDSYYQQSGIGFLVATSRGSLEKMGAPGEKRDTLVPHGFPGNVRGIICTPDSCLYVGSESSGLLKCDLKTHSCRNIAVQLPRIRALCQDTGGRIWIGTANNLFIYDPLTETITETAPDTSNPESLSNASVRSLLCDSSGGIWVGTFFGGVNYYSPWRSRFESIRYSSPDKDIVGCVREDSSGYLWVGTYRDGLLIYDPSHRRYSAAGDFAPDDRGETKDIKAIEFVGEKVYVGAELGGLSIFDRRSGKSKKISNCSQFTSVYNIYPTTHGKYWTATNGGLFLLDPSDNSLTKTEEKRLVRKIHRSSANDLWIGGDNFLLRYFVAADESLTPIRDFEEISWVQDIKSFGEYVWVGTRSGLFRYSLGKGEMKKMDLGRTVSVKAIEDGGNEKIWFSAEDGIYCYDSFSGKTRRYSSADGLVCTTYNIGAGTRLSDGSICFGGLKGITLFNPSDIIPRATTENPVISRILIDGEETDIPADGIVQIYAGKKVISLSFSSPDYVSWKNVSFRYILEGFDKRERISDISHTATYSNLPKGKYTFRVRSVNPDGISSLCEASVTIKVNPEWYQTTVFVIFISLLFACALAYSVINYIRRIRKDSTRQIEGLKLRLYSGPTAEGEMTEENTKFLRQAIKTVTENMSNTDFSAEMFSTEMGLSRTGLHTKLKAITGDSALEFIKKVRFNEACDLLNRGGLTIAEIAYKVGYSSPAYFTTSFKKRFGKTPKEYQETTLKSHR